MNSKYNLNKSPQESMLMRYFRWFFVKHHLKRCLFCIWIVKVIMIIVVLPSSQLSTIIIFKTSVWKPPHSYCTLFSLIHYSTVRPHKKLFVVRTVIWPLCSLSLLLQNCNNGGFKEENDGKIFKLSSSVSCQNGFTVCVHCSI